MCIMRGIIATVTATSSHSGRRSYGENWSKGINKPLSIFTVGHTHTNQQRVWLFLRFLLVHTLLPLEKLMLPISNVRAHISHESQKQQQSKNTSVRERPIKRTEKSHLQIRPARPNKISMD